jgi:type IV pilus biogenesis protein PilP
MKNLFWKRLFRTEKNRQYLYDFPIDSGIDLLSLSVFCQRTDAMFALKNTRGRFRNVAIATLLASVSLGALAHAQTAPGPYGEKPGAPLLSPTVGQGVQAPDTSGTDLGSDSKLPSADISGHMGDIDETAALQRKLTILKLQEQITNIQANIKKTNDEAAADSPAATPGAGVNGVSGVAAAPNPKATQAAMMAANQAQAATKALPLVVSVGGVSGHFTADIMVPFAGEFSNVHAGDLLPNNVRVLAINGQGVKAELSDGSRVLLSEGNKVPATFSGASTAGVAPNSMQANGAAMQQLTGVSSMPTTASSGNRPASSFASPQIPPQFKQTFTVPPLIESNPPGAATNQ